MMDTATQKPVKPGPIIAFATTLGYSVGIIIPLYIWLYGGEISWLPYLSPFSGFMGIGGIFIGLAQSIVLRKLIRIRWWVLASIVGCGFGYLLTSLVENVLFNVGALGFFIWLGLIGLLIGFFQSLVLQGKYTRAYWWIAINIIGWWFLGVFSVIWMYSGVLQQNSYRSAVAYMAENLLFAGVFPGFVLGIITGIGLGWIMRGPVKEKMGTEAAVATEQLIR